MTYDPYEEAGLRRDLPKTDPRMVDPEDTRATIWLPIVIAVALFIGLGYYFYGHVEREFPDARGQRRDHEVRTQPELIFLAQERTPHYAGFSFVVSELTSCRLP